MATSNKENILDLFGNNSFFDLKLPDEDIPAEDLTATIGFLKEPFNILKPPTSKKQRFAKPMTTQQIEAAAKPSVPKKTTQSTHWALWIFSEWVRERNSHLGESVILECPSDLLDRCNGKEYGYPYDVLDHWLAAFVSEVRQSNGKQYTAPSLNCILAGIYRHLKDKLNDRAPKILEKTSCEFPMFKNALDRQLKFLRNTGVGVERNRAKVISVEMEDQLWECGILGFSSPANLLNECSSTMVKTFVCAEFKSSTICVSPKLFASIIQIDTPTVSMDRKIEMEG